MRNVFDKLLNWYFTKNSLPYWCIFLIDCAIILFSGYLTFWIFSNVLCLLANFYQVTNTLLCFILLSIPGFRLFHTYSSFMRYSSFVDLKHVAYGNFVNLCIVLVASYGLDYLPDHWFTHFNTTSIFLIYIFSTLLMWGIRVFVKILYDVAISNTRAVRVLIYGAMSGGVGLAKNLHNQRPRQFLVKGFITHHHHTKHQEIMGEKVYSVDDDLAQIIKSRGIKGVLVAPNRTEEFRHNQKLQDVIIGAGAKIYMAQNVRVMDDNDEAVEKPVQMRAVSVEDLLPRNEIRVDLKSVEELLMGQRVLITGSAGSIGSEIVRQVAEFKPAALMLIDQAETPEHDIRLMMEKEFPQIPADTVVANICNKSRMEEIFRQFKPDYVFHAAAYKHVPMMEDNPSEAVINNIFGTKVIADLSVKYGVKKFVMISTDKAVNPTNVMGCSKRICEIYVQSLDQAIKEKRISQTGSPSARTQFVTTRFGNVLGSNGSVIPLFREQIKNGGPVTVTDERIVRFFMLIPEACKLVLEAGTKGNGGEIFVFDMGMPVKIVDLAKRMIKLSGAKNVEIKFTGLRPGEKLYEEVLSDMEGTKPTFHEKIRIAEVREYDYQKVSKDIDELIEISMHYDDMATVKKMKEIVPEYKSNNSKYEELDK